MAVAFDASSVSALTSGSFSWTHTTGAGANSYMLVFVGLHQSGDSGLTAVSYNGAALTRLGATAGSTAISVSLWYLANPAAGAHSVAVTNSSGASEALGFAQTFTGVNQSISWAQGTNWDVSSPAAGNNTIGGLTVAGASMLASGGCEYTIKGTITDLTYSGTRDRVLIDGATTEAWAAGHLAAGGVTSTWTKVGGDGCGQAAAVLDAAVTTVPSWKPPIIMQAVQRASYY